MPVVNITMGKADVATKKNIIENVTKTFSQTTSIPEDKVTVIIDEKDYENIGVGGNQVSELMKK